MVELGLETTLPTHHKAPFFSGTSAARGPGGAVSEKTPAKPALVLIRRRAMVTSGGTVEADSDRHTVSVVQR